LSRKTVGAGGMSRIGADALLLTTAAVWGVTFVVQKDIGVLPPLAFVAARFAVSALAVAPLAVLKGRRAGLPSAPRAWRLAVAIGVMLFLGASLQQAGLATTSATNGGFLTACYVVLTPFVVWALSRQRPRAIVLAAGVVSLAGAWLLATGGGPAGPPTIGDGLVLLADLAWAIAIALTPIFLIKTERPLTLANMRSAAPSPPRPPRCSRRRSPNPSSPRRRRSFSRASSPARSAIRFRLSGSATRPRLKRR
jgi:drug/metabolite transporter (DMT)-like permease